MCVEVVPAVQIDARGGKVNGGNRRRCSINVQAGGVRPLTRVVKQIELDRYALIDTSITEITPQSPQGRYADVLNRKRHAVGDWIGQLEGEIGGERLDVHRSGEKGATGLVLSAICQLQPEVVQVGAAVELYLPIGKSKPLAEVDCVDVVSGAHRRAGDPAWADGNGRYG